MGLRSLLPEDYSAVDAPDAKQARGQDAAPQKRQNEPRTPEAVPADSPQVAANKRWREKNREHYLAKQREYQRAYRARKKKGEGNG